MPRVKRTARKSAAATGYKTARKQLATQSARKSAPATAYKAARKSAPATAYKAARKQIATRSSRKSAPATAYKAARKAAPATGYKAARYRPPTSDSSIAGTPASVPLSPLSQQKKESAEAMRIVCEAHRAGTAAFSKAFRQAICDNERPRKRTRLTTGRQPAAATPPCDFAEIEHHLTAMNSSKLVQVLKSVWSNGGDVRRAFSEAVPLTSAWVSHPDQTEMLSHAWRLCGHDDLDLTADEVYLYTNCDSVPISSQKCAEGSVCIDEGGCPECGEAQYYKFDLQKNRAGVLRLCVHKWIQCRCNLCPGESPNRYEADDLYYNVVDEEEENDYSPES